ncbi:hypothetical protein Tco_1085291, partial [Tanacetum coccineum]
VWVESSPPSSGKWAAKRKLMMRVGPLVLSLDGKLLGTRRMTKKINVHPKWLTLQTLTNVAKRKLVHLLLHLVNSCKKKTNDESGTPRSQSGWKTSWDTKEGEEDEGGSSPPSTGKWAVKRKLMMRVGPLVLSLDGKLLGPRRMTKKINVHPEWKTLQTLTNELVWVESSPPSSGKWVAKRKPMMRVGPFVVSGWKTSWAKKDDKEDQCCKKKTSDESGTPHSQSGWKTSWAKKDDKEDQCASRSGWKTSWDKKDDKEDQCVSRVEDSSNTNQWGKKEAGSSPSSSGK